jgi:thiol-disulfide isomerase/thioredoxin
VRRSGLAVAAAAALCACAARPGAPTRIEGVPECGGGPDGSQKAAADERVGSCGLADFDWPLLSVDGDTTSLASFAGRVLFINVWATWCAPCVAELASIERLHESMAGAPVTFLIVSPEPVDRVAVFQRRYGYRLPVHVELREMPAAFGLRVLPTTYIVSAAGEIVLRHRGAADWDKGAVREFLHHLVEAGAMHEARSGAASAGVLP